MRYVDDIANIPSLTDEEIADGKRALAELAHMREDMAARYPNAQWDSVEEIRRMREERDEQIEQAIAGHNVPTS